MRVGVLLSGGKDSVYSCWRAMEYHKVVCFITIRSQNHESYMFHTPNIDLTRLQAEAAGIPLIEWETRGEKEVELDDLALAIRSAIDQFNIEGVVSGAIQSVYQAARVQKICADLGLWSFNPLWLCDQEQYLNDLINAGFVVIVAGVFSAPFDESWLGRQIDVSFVRSLSAMSGRWGISLTGEGGEYESFVCDAPFFQRNIQITSAETEYQNHNGRYYIRDARLVEK